MSESSTDVSPDFDEEAEIVSPIVENARRNMGDTWRLEDEEFLDKFFPIEPDSASRYEKAFAELYNNSKRYKRWKRIPTKPKSPSSLHTPLTNLMNRVLFHYAISRDDRLFLNTHCTDHKSASIGIGISPSIFLAGVGPEFANTWTEVPRTSFASCISACEVALDSDDQIMARNRLAVHMHWIFERQVNRRFAFGLVITQSMFTVYMFDHSGATASPPCDYHAHPGRFCAVISGLASQNERIGFDNSMFCEDRLTKIRTTEPVDDEGIVTDYVIDHGIFRATALVGRGTKCWLTSRTGDSNSTFVIKDAWIAPSERPGRESEGSLLLHAKSRGVCNGVAQIHHFEDIRCGPTSDLDTVLRNRRLNGTSPDILKLERVHTRIVMATYGKTLDQFSSRRELVLAFHDAVLAHRNLHEVAGILHRDISVRNILINPKGVEGNRGILIDFDHAIRVTNTSPYSHQRKIGTWRYMSRNVLKNNLPHTYLDDLESFYYVLCWILVAYQSPGVSRAELPGLISAWDKPDSFYVKRGSFSMEFRLPVSPWFGQSLRTLAVRIHEFFNTRDSFYDDPPPELDAVKDYDEFISHIKQSVVDLEQEEASGNSFTSSDVSGVPASSKRNRDSYNHDEDETDLRSVPTHHRAKANRTIRLPLVKRPRRNAANYGHPSDK